MLFGGVDRTINNEEVAFNTYLAKYGKVYAKKEEYVARFEMFRQSLHRIERFEKEETEKRVATNGTEGNTTFGLNSMSDWFQHEKDAMRADKGKLKQKKLEPSNDKYPIKVREFSTSSINPIDWRKSGCVTKPRAQGNCASCWAFSVAAAMETYACEALGSDGYLSPQ